MDSLDKDGLKLSEISHSYAAEYKAKLNILHNQEEALAELKRENGQVLRDIAELKAQKAHAEKVREMRRANERTLEEQRILYQEIVIPQLKKELQEKTELADAKRKEYAEIIQFHKDKWEKYLEVYMRYPGAAERLDAQNRTKLMRIEVMKKEREVIVKAEQAAKLQEIKAKRLELKQKEVMREYAIIQDLQRKYDNLKAENEERKQRIAAKRAAKEEEQRRLDEERKEQEYQQAQAAQEVDKSDSSQEAAGSSFLKAIMIPKFQMPRFDWDLKIPSTPLQHPSKKHKQSSMPCSPLRTPPSSGTPGICSQFSPKTSLEQPSHLRPCQTPFRASIISPHDIKESSFPQEQDEPSNKAIDSKVACASVEHQENMQTLLSNTLPITPHVRKELVLSTDNIAAKMKETIRPKPNTTQNDTVIKIGHDSAEKEGSTFVSNENATQHHQAVVSSSIAQQPAEEENIHGGNKSPQFNDDLQVEDEEMPSDAQLHRSSPDIFSSQIENARELSEDDPPYDYNAEYGDLSIQSPPAFDCVMSPAPANFESSPSHSMDDDKDSSGPTCSFGGFDFFSQTKSDKGKEKSNAFSFMF